MPYTDYREFSPAYRHIRIRRIEALKAVVRANNYHVGSRDIAEGIIRDARRDTSFARRS
ncbi:MAG: flagellar biosynthesis anti-sigma factor FlgM [Gaiellales bacterium]|nr:MAG: flagellar biosynthesis anti-sigma factor FlgM [Gaiellales bacterium]